MTSFPRLRDGELDGVKRALLESAMDDVPDERAEDRALAFLGLGAGTAAVGAAAGHSAAVAIGAHGAAATGAVKSAGALTALTILKWVGIGAAVGSVVAGSAVAVSFSQEASSHRQETHAATPLPHRVPQTNMKPRVDLPSAAGVGETSPSDVPRAALPDVARAAPTSVERTEAPNEARRAAGTALVAPPIAGASATEAFPQRSPQSAPSSVVDEVASLDVARAELASGNAKGALAQLGAHDHAFPDGALTPEATVLRVRALVQLDELDQARTVARAFIASHPNGPQANHLRLLVGE